jgi:hypothetical protein
MDRAECFLEDWHRIVAARDLDGLAKILAEDVTLGAPPYWGKIEGRPLVVQLLGLIIHTIEDFTYHREWQQGAELALEFRGHVAESELQGIDLLTLNAAGEVQNLDVLMRPLNAVSELRDLIAPQMADYLKRLKTTT